MEKPCGFAAEVLEIRLIPGFIGLSKNEEKCFAQLLKVCFFPSSGYKLAGFSTMGALNRFHIPNRRTGGPICAFNSTIHILTASFPHSSTGCAGAPIASHRHQQEIKAILTAEIGERSRKIPAGKPIGGFSTIATPPTTTTTTKIKINLFYFSF
ncbi:MAG: hypothetical protein IJ493_09555 [Clostridia bacterium]|nr:hypothetical protein [Clostridia bacterium]